MKDMKANFYEEGSNGVAQTIAFPNGVWEREIKEKGRSIK